MSELLYEGVSKSFKGKRVVQEVSFRAEGGRITVLMGPSGSGKTTLLRMANRLVEPTEGRVLLDGEDVSRMDPLELRRSTGYVVQQIGLFPHMTVEENIALVPRLKGWSEDRARRRAAELLEMVGLDPSQYLRRYPRQLSGGQQQRVGVARALAGDPRLILMDEPFSHLDPTVRRQLQLELLRIQRELGKTVLFVTHDVEEAVRLADRICFLADGKLIQEGSPTDLLFKPLSEKVKSFFSSASSMCRMERVSLLDFMNIAGRPYPPPAQSAPSANFKLRGSTSVLEALSLMAREGADEALVEEEGLPLGEVRARELAGFVLKSLQEGGCIRWR